MYKGKLFAFLPVDRSQKRMTMSCPKYSDFIRCKKLSSVGFLDCCAFIINSFHVYFEADTDPHSPPWVVYHCPTVSPYFLWTIGLEITVSFLPSMETTDMAAHLSSIYSKIRLHCRLIAVFTIFFQIIIIICHIPAFTNARIKATVKTHDATSPSSLLDNKVSSALVLLVII